MENVILFAALGLGAGALIASIALGVVLVYRGSGVINVAMGAIAMLAAYFYWAFKTGYFGFHLSSPPAFVLTLACMAAFGVLIELAIFRPLRNAAPLAKLAASLGLLLVLEAGVVVVFGNSTKSAPSILTSGTVTIFDRVVPKDRFLLAVIVIVVTVVLAALYRWTPFGLSTRAASENEVSAMLAGLSPNRLAIMNTVLACVVVGGLGILVAPLISLDSQTLALQVVPALAAALLAGFTSFFIACFAGLAIGVVQSLLIYWGTQTWFPTDSGGTPIRGLPELFVFLVIVLALFLRGASLPGRGELVEKRLPAVPRPERLLRPATIALAIGVVALIVFPFDFRQSLINSLLGVIICLSLVMIIGFVGQISVVQLALAGVAGFTMSHLTTDAGGIWATFPISLLIGASVATIIGLLIGFSALRVRGVSLVVVTLAAAVALEQFGFQNERWGGGATGSPVDQPKLGGVNLSPDASFRGLDDKLPSPIFGFLVLVATILLGHARRQRAPLEPGAADAGRPLQRARRGGGRDQRPQRQARGLRHRRLRRRDGRWALRLQLRLGQLHPLRGAGSARPDRVRLLRRHHHGHGGDPRGRRRGGGPLPARFRQVARPVGQLGVPGGRLRPHHHTPRQPGGHRRHGLEEGAAEEETESCRGRRREARRRDARPRPCIRRAGADDGKPAPPRTTGAGRRHPRRNGDHGQLRRAAGRSTTSTSRSPRASSWG